MRRIRTTPSVSAQRTETTASRKWWIPALVGVTFTLFLLAVFAAGVSIRASYTLAQLQQRREVALHEQQILQEELAEVTSLAHSQAYAEETGFSTSALPIATLDLSTPVAQR